MPLSPLMNTPIGHKTPVAPRFTGTDRPLFSRPLSPQGQPPARPPMARAMMLPLLLLSLFVGPRLMRPFLDTPIGDATQRASQSYRAAHGIVVGNLKNTDLLADARNQALAAHFRNLMAEVSAHSQNQQWQLVEALLPGARLSPEEERYTRDLVAAFEKNPAAFTNGLQYFHSWLDKVVAPHVAPEVVQGLKADSRAFWDDMTGHIAKAGILPLVPTLMMVMLMMGLLVRDVARQHRQRNG